MKGYSIMASVCYDDEGGYHIGCYGENAYVSYQLKGLDKLEEFLLKSSNDVFITITNRDIKLSDMAERILDGRLCYLDEL